MKFYEFFIGLRYLKSKKEQGFISFNTVLSVFIVFIGVFILIVVLSVMNGFQSQIKDKILDVDSHISVTKLANHFSGKSIRDYKSLTKKLKGIKGVKSAYPYVQGQGLFRFRQEVGPVLIRGIGSKNDIPQDTVKFIKENRESFAQKRGVYIGKEMATNYGIKKNQVIELIVPKGRLNYVTGVTPGIGRFRVLGFFKTGYYDFDTKMVLMSLKDSQRLFALGNVAYGVGLKIKDIFSMDKMAAKIQATVGFDFYTMTAEQRNHNLFYALKLEKLIMTIILFLVIVSAGFTIMGTIVMVIMEKKKSIGVLKSMGAKPKSIMIIFLLEGFLIGVTGTFLGVVLGLATALNLEAIIIWIEDMINLIMVNLYQMFNWGTFYRIDIVPTNVYYIDSIPTEISPEFVTFIAGIAVFLATFAAIFPAWHASRQKPVETIRYE